MNLTKLATRLNNVRRIKNQLSYNLWIVFFAVADDTSSTLERGKERVKDTAQSVKESMQDTAQSAQEKGKGMFEKIKDTLTPNN